MGQVQVGPHLVMPMAAESVYVYFPYILTVLTLRVIGKKRLKLCIARPHMHMNRVPGTETVHGPVQFQGLCKPLSLGKTTENHSKCYKQYGELNL